MRRTSFPGLVATIGVLLAALSAVGIAERAPRVRLLAVTLKHRTPAADRIEVKAAVDNARRGDSLALTLHSFPTCTAATATRAAHLTEVFDDTVDARTVVRLFDVPRAARQEVTATLVSTETAFAPTRQTKAFKAAKGGCK